MVKRRENSILDTDGGRRTVQEQQIMWLGRGGGKRKNKKNKKSDWREGEKKRKNEWRL